ncbi:MAG TPA: extracellular solute-binding protein [Candidatus Angelobacter sp.]|nr:extracellular solute-binding protein [Candidatus Angelobacter sp.]
MAAGGVGIVSARPARELNLLNRPDELPDPVIPNFEKATGITVKSTPFLQDDELIAGLRATGGEGFDLCQPTRDRALQFKELGVLGAFDVNKLPNSTNLVPSLFNGSTSVWSWDGGLRHLPHCWGTEAISWRSDRTVLEYRNLSFGTLWEDQYRGAVQGRPDALLLGIGLWMDRTGRLPSNRMLDAYKDEESMTAIYDVILKFAIDRRAWIRQFWGGADDAKTGFTENGCTIGKTWDGPALSLKKDGLPIGYMAPQEGAITWLDGWAIAKTAKNLEEAYEFLNYLMTPEVSAQIAEGSSYNPVVAGVHAHLSQQARKSFAEAYPEDALLRLWHRPPEPSWFAALRVRYAGRYRAALQEA